MLATLGILVAGTAIALIGGAVAPAPAGAAASGCGSHASGSGTLTLTFAGRRRTVIVHVPRGYVGSARVALVLNMHGSASTAAEQEGFTGMDATADADDFIVAYPQALIPDGSGFDWNVPGVPLIGGRAVPAGAANDVAFLTGLAGVLEGRYCVNPARVYATGFSGGARMASQLACDSAGVFAAVAPVSGLRRPTPCPASRPVAVLAFHGTADPIDPYGGHGEPYWTYSVQQAQAYWASQDGCSPKPATTKPGHGVTLTTYAGCHGGVVVELYSVGGEGHEWPGGPLLPAAYTSVLGPQSNAVDADAVIWSFFAAHPMP
jgi:polyhydroxybutyrate depolymerase